MPRLNQQFRLSDGRRFGYDDHGPEDGRPLFFLPGTPASRHAWYLLGQSEDDLARPGLRVIAIDRPGLGLSDFQEHRRIGDLPADLAELADHLGIGRFSVLGYSGGGPYALAAALKIPDRLSKVGVVAGMGPHDVPGLTDGIHPSNVLFTHLARDRPLPSRVAHLLVAFLVRLTPQSLAPRSTIILPEPDAKVVEQREVRRVMAEMMGQANRGWARGAVHDTALMVSPWDFDPAEIVMSVTFWHGEQDETASPAMARYLADAVRYSTLHMYPEHAHISLLVDKGAEILGTFV